MNTSKPFSLTDDQLVVVRAGASALPVRWRSRYLALVADELLACPCITDSDVHHVVGCVIAAMTKRERVA